MPQTAHRMVYLSESIASFFLIAVLAAECGLWEQTGVDL